MPRQYDKIFKKIYSFELPCIIHKLSISKTYELSRLQQLSVIFFEKIIAYIQFVKYGWFSLWFNLFSSQNGEKQDSSKRINLNPNPFSLLRI